eukprot:Platyproteum_vivax@DN15347_c0_g1_i1.p1
MLNFIRRNERGYNLLFGKNEFQRVHCGYNNSELKVPLIHINRLYEKLDKSLSYHGGTYSPLPWKEFISIKIDAQNLIQADTKSALTDIKWYPAVTILYQGHKALTELDVALKCAPKKMKFPIAPE